LDHEWAKTKDKNKNNVLSRDPYRARGRPG